MAEYIEREAFLERVDGIWDCADMVFEPNDKCCRADDCASCKWRETKNAIRKIAANIPAADVRENKRGRWQSWTQDRPPCKWYSCDYCGYHSLAETPFCPNCGADMRPTSMSGANGEES